MLEIGTILHPSVVFRRASATRLNVPCTIRFLCGMTKKRSTFARLWRTHHALRSTLRHLRLCCRTTLTIAMMKMMMSPTMNFRMQNPHPVRWIGYPSPAHWKRRLPFAISMFTSTMEPPPPFHGFSPKPPSSFVDFIVTLIGTETLSTSSTPRQNSKTSTSVTTRKMNILNVLR